MSKEKFSIRRPGKEIPLGKPLQEMSGPLWPGGPTAEKMFREMPKKAPDEIQAEMNQMDDFAEFMSTHPDAKRIGPDPNNPELDEYESDRPMHELLAEYCRTREPKQ